MQLAKECLLQAFPDAAFTPHIMSEAYGMGSDALPYSNMLMQATTQMDSCALTALFKQMEHTMGDTAQLRSEGIVMMDLDLLRYGRQRHHESDWLRPYIKQLLNLLGHPLLILLMFLITLPTFGQRADDNHRETFAKAVEYYQGQKYHESILAFEKLRKKYTLSPRFEAYLGYSYYKEQMYAEAILHLEPSIPSLTAYSPQEQAIFIYSCAESYFLLGQYAAAIPHYESMLSLVSGNNRADVLYHTAMSHFMLNNIEAAIPLFQEALDIYTANASPTDKLHTARQRQIKNMLHGLLSAER